MEDVNNISNVTESLDIEINEIVTEGFGDILGKIFDAIKKAITTFINFIGRIIKAITDKLKKHEKNKPDPEKELNDLYNKIQEDDRKLEHEINTFPDNFTIHDLYFDYSSKDASSIKAFYDAVCKIINDGWDKVFAIDKPNWAGYNNADKVTEKTIQPEIDNLKELIENNSKPDYEFNYFNGNNAVSMVFITVEVKRLCENLKKQLETTRDSLSTVETRYNREFSNFSSTHHATRGDIMKGLLATAKSGYKMKPSNPPFNGDDWRMLVALYRLANEYGELVKLALKASNIISHDAVKFADMK